MGFKTPTRTCEFYMKILLSTTPPEGQFVDWTTPRHFEGYKVNKYMPLGILSLASNIC